MAYRSLFALVIVSLATISKAGLGDFLSDLGNDIKDTWNDVVNGVQDLGDNIANSVSKEFSNEYH